MSEYISFENNTKGFKREFNRFEEPEKPFLVRKLLQYKIAKDDKAANKILIIATVVIICISLLIIALSNHQPVIRTIHIK